MDKQQSWIKSSSRPTQSVIWNNRKIAWVLLLETTGRLLSQLTSTWRKPKWDSNRSTIASR